MNDSISQNIEKQVVKLQKMLRDIDKKLILSKKDNPKYIEWFQKKKWLTQEIDLRLNGAALRCCGKCKKDLGLENFGITLDTNQWCNKCRSDYHLARRNEDTEKAKIKARNAHLLFTYNFTSKQYDQMFADQNGVCACCGQPETRKSAGRNAKKYPERIAPLAVDHNHETDEVRALLCAECNISLGHMHEDTERIQKLKEYAEWCQSLKS